MTEGRGYIRARLITAQLQLVRDITLPPFDKPPQIVIYGSRVFRKITASDESGFLYAETTSYQVPFEDVEEEDGTLKLENT